MIDGESIIAAGETPGHRFKVTWGDLYYVAFANPSELVA
jgi:hypothetical protein